MCNHKIVYGMGSIMSYLYDPQDTTLLENMLGLNIFGSYERARSEQTSGKKNFAYDGTSDMCQK